MCRLHNVKHEVMTVNDKLGSIW